MRSLVVKIRNLRRYQHEIARCFHIRPSTPENLCNNNPSIYKYKCVDALWPLERTHEPSRFYWWKYTLYFIFVSSSTPPSSRDRRAKNLTGRTLYRFLSICNVGCWIPSTLRFLLYLAGLWYFIAHRQCSKWCNQEYRPTLRGDNIEIKLTKLISLTTYTDMSNIAQICWCDGD